MPGDTKAVNYQGVPTATDVEQTLLPEPDDLFGYRNIFRVDSEAENRDGDSVEYPALDGDFEGELVEIEKGDPHPVSKLTYDGMQAGWQDYGFKFPLHDNDIQDAKINLVMVNQRNENEERMRALDGVAGAVLEANRNSTEIGDSSTDFNYDAAVNTETEMIAAGFSPGSFMWVLSPHAWGSIAKSEDFTSATERFADELRGQGIRHGELLNYPALRVNTGPLQGSQGAYLVDTSRYGWESPRRGFSVDREYDKDESCYWYYTDGRIDWVPTNPESAIKAVGGATTSG